MWYFMFFAIFIVIIIYIITKRNNRKYMYITVCHEDADTFAKLIAQNKRYKVTYYGYMGSNTLNNLHYYVRYADLTQRNKFVLSKQLYYVTNEKKDYEIFLNLLKNNNLYSILETKEHNETYIVNEDKKSNNEYLVKYKYEGEQ